MVVGFLVPRVEYDICSLPKIEQEPCTKRGKCEHYNLCAKLEMACSNYYYYVVTNTSKDSKLLIKRLKNKKPNKMYFLRLFGKKKKEVKNEKSDNF